MKVLGVIPARYGSVRFPGKPLIKILDKPMIQWVYETAIKALGRVVVATDDSRIYRAVQGFGGRVIMTSRCHKSGTDRMAEVAGKISAAIYVNIQGDEPLISKDIISNTYKLLTTSGADIGTAASILKNEKEYSDPNVVKVVMDKNRYALYFSRSPIPFFREGYSNRYSGRICKHLGIYSYKRSVLKKFVKIRPTFLEKAERLEQLRALENGHRIKVFITSKNPIGVDVPADLKQVEKILKKRR